MWENPVVFLRIHFIKGDEKFLEVKKKKNETIYIEKITDSWLTLCDQAGFFFFNSLFCVHIDKTICPKMFM